MPHRLIKMRTEAKTGGKSEALIALFDRMDDDAKKIC